MKMNIIFPVLISLLFLSCATSKNSIIDFKKAPLYGMIYDLNNNPLSGVLIKIKTEHNTTAETDPEEDNIVRQAISDINGRFVIPNLKKGNHTLFSSLEDFEKMQLEFAFLNRTRVMYLKMVSLNNLLQYAEDALGKKEYKEAGEMLKRAAVLKPEVPQMLYLKAVLFFKEQQPEQAEEYFKDATINVKLLSFKFTVIGEVNRPGTFTNFNNFGNYFR